MLSRPQRAQAAGVFAAEQRPRARHTPLLFRPKATTRAARPPPLTLPGARLIAASAVRHQHAQQIDLLHNSSLLALKATEGLPGGTVKKGSSATLRPRRPWWYSAQPSRTLLRLPGTPTMTTCLHGHQLQQPVLLSRSPLLSSAIILPHCERAQRKTESRASAQNSRSSGRSA